MPQPQRSAFDKGFDLVGSIFRVLLALFALYILVLFALFLSINHDNKGQRHRTACQSNLKQLGLALTQYTQDSDNVLPPLVSATGQGWREAVYPYVKSTSVYECPDDQFSGNASPTDLPKSYGASTLGPGPKGKDQGAFAGPMQKLTTLLDFPDPLHIIAVTDMRGGGEADWNMGSPAFLPNTGRRLNAHFPKHWFFERPEGTLNCLFLDGHVKGLAPEATLTPSNLWTRDSTPFTGQDMQNARAILARAAQE